MKLSVLFFASLREQLQTGNLIIDSDTTYSTVGALIDMLSTKGVAWQQALSVDNLVFAVNQTVVGIAYELQDGDEVAFYPPVTGG